MISFWLDTFELRFIDNWDFLAIRFNSSNPPDEWKDGREGEMDFIRVQTFATKGVGSSERTQVKGGK